MKRTNGAPRGRSSNAKRPPLWVHTGQRGKASARAFPDCAIFPPFRGAASALSRVVLAARSAHRIWRSWQMRRVACFWCCEHIQPPEESIPPAFVARAFAQRACAASAEMMRLIAHMRARAPLTSRESCHKSRARRGMAQRFPKTLEEGSITANSLLIFLLAGSPRRRSSGGVRRAADAERLRRTASPGVTYAFRPRRGQWPPLQTDPARCFVLARTARVARNCLSRPAIRFTLTAGGRGARALRSALVTSCLSYSVTMVEGFVF
ncbi:hypothetical protein MRX96_031089 [Rhipicephalus microplus]